MLYFRCFSFTFNSRLKLEIAHQKLLNKNMSNLATINQLMMQIENGYS